MADSDPLWINAGKASSAVGTATIAQATDLFTIASHGLANGDRVTVDTLTGGAVGVLTANAVYYVVTATTNTFQVAETLAGAPILFSVDGGAAVYRYQPAYSAVELRRAIGMLLLPGVGDRFGARAGIRPNTAEAVSLSGTTWTVQHLQAVVYPGLSTVAGPYIVAHPSESGVLNAADGTNPRHDALDLQIQDTDEDASGQRRARIVYAVGTPAGSPADPALTANSLRLCTILVPATGSPAPSILTRAPFTVALGGVLPVRTASELPTAGRYEGMAAYQQDIDRIVCWNGTAWVSAVAAIERIGTTERTSTVGSITTTETTVDTVTIAAVTGRRYGVRLHSTAQSTVANDEVNMALREDNSTGTRMDISRIKLVSSGAGYKQTLYAEWTAGSTGNKTFVGTLVRDSGTGTISAPGGATQKQYIVVDYISG